MLSGSVELFGETIIITFRLVNVKTEAIEKSHVREYLNLPRELQSMIRISLRELFWQPTDAVLLSQLTRPNMFESVVSNPEQTRLNLSGPRTGVAMFTGEFKKILTAGENKGGYNIMPVLYQFGYQFEIMYLNEGNFQALFEFLPIITGINQNKIWPSITLMNGVRHNLHGLEIAMGPNFSISNKLTGYYDANNNWHRREDWNGEGPTPNFAKRADSRGKAELSSSFVIAIGKTFRSGKMKLPVNVYCIPDPDGLQLGLSVGYNAKNKKSSK